MISLNLSTKKILIFFSILLYIATRFHTLLYQGEVFDEEAISVPSYHVWSSIAEFDFSEEAHSEHFEHAPLPRYFYGLFYIIEQRITIIKNTFDYMYIPEKQMFLQRVASMFLGLGTMYFLYRISKRVFDEKVALFTLFIYVTMPHLIPYNAAVTQESLLLFLSTVFIFYYLKYLDQQSNTSLLILYALLPYLFYAKQMGIFYVLFFVLLFFDNKHYNSFKQIKLHFIGIFLAIILLYFSWPWLWTNPLNIFEHLAYHTDRTVEEYFLGIYQAAPKFYYYLYSIITIPITYFILGAVGIIRICKESFRCCNKYRNTLLIWLILPFLANFLPFKQDGIRYIITYQLTFTIFIAFGLSYILDMVKNFYAKFLLLVIVGLNIISVFYVFNPYYLDYYNILTGGIENVYKNKLFEFGWWGEGTLEAMDYINKNYNDSQILLMINPEHVIPKLINGNKIISKNPDDIFDSKNILPELILLSDNKKHLFVNELSEKYHLVHTVKIDNAILFSIFELKHMNKN